MRHCTMSIAFLAKPMKVLSSPTAGTQLVTAECTDSRDTYAYMHSHVSCQYELKWDSRKGFSM